MTKNQIWQAAIAFILCVMAIVIITTGRSRPHQEPPAATAAATNVPAETPTPSGTPAVGPSPIAAFASPEALATVRPLPAVDQLPLVEKIRWGKLNNGCTMELTDTGVHITGLTDKDGWGHWNGIQTPTQYPPGDFSLGVDFKVTDFSGPGKKLVYLRAGTAQSDFVAILYTLGGSYQVQAWTDPMSYAGPVAPFGDEATAFHHMRLDYNAASQTATGWIDNTLIGDLTYPLRGNMHFEIGANTDTKGMNIDLTFEHFTLRTGKAEAGKTDLP